MHRLTTATLLALSPLAPLLASCGGPCTDCPDVAGTYAETMAVTNAGESSCNTIYSRGGTVQLTVAQEGSRVRVRWARDSAALSGVLNADLSLQLDEFPGVAKSESGEGPTVPLSMLLSGVFSGPPGARTFDGVYQASAKTEDCITRVKTRWVQVPR